MERCLDSAEWNDGMEQCMEWNSGTRESWVIDSRYNNAHTSL